ncbi:hypothetical protein SCLCIDRAFT_143504 [Scleroderma citrinum Foug A]|uniref:HAT C-terminal dimerisation domain-containing protein n=1 Tax=Scleroderma citrinum Foug A TaxID=1036808 RepID=A0A0C3D5C6_9AGAM|nr:hypothetical protein SCLCIDRAFT_143504 [Scleroderma citrinum Foug A]
MYPQLSHMALNYLTIPATSINVEQLFSCGRLLLLHIRSRLSAQTTRSLLCLGVWSTLGLVDDSNVKKVMELQDAEGKDVVLADGWDKIII